MKDLRDFIIEIRGERVILDFNLAKLYGVKNKSLKQSVRRNIERFPDDFMFMLTDYEVIHMRSQFVTSERKSIGRSPPMAFTETGVAMLSSVLKSSRAIEINIMLIRIFIIMRKAFTSNNDINLKISAIENELSTHSTQLQILFDQLSRLSEEDNSSDDKIGFKVDI